MAPAPDDIVYPRTHLLYMYVHSCAANIAGYRLYNYCITLYFRGKWIWNIFARRYFREYTVHAEISSRENIFPRKYLLAKISSRENILARKSFACFVSVASFSLFAARWSGTPVAGLTLDLEFASDRRNNGIIPTISNLDRVPISSRWETQRPILF